MELSYSIPIKIIINEARKKNVMAESNSHKRAKSKATGGIGRTEVLLRGNCSSDTATPGKANECERNGTMVGLAKTAKRLKHSGRPQKVLIVPQKDMAKAVKAMQNVGITGTV